MLSRVCRFPFPWKLKQTVLSIRLNSLNILRSKFESKIWTKH